MYQKVPDGAASFEIHFYTMFSADIFVAVTHTFHIGHNYVRLVVITAGVLLVIVRNMVSSIVEMLFFLLKQLVVGTDSLCSVF